MPLEKTEKPIIPATGPQPPKAAEATRKSESISESIRQKLEDIRTKSILENKKIRSESHAPKVSALENKKFSLKSHASKGSVLESYVLDREKVVSDEIQHPECSFFVFEAAPVIEAGPTGVVIPFPTLAPAPAPVPALPPVPIVVRPPQTTHSDFIGPKQWVPPDCTKSSSDKGRNPNPPQVSIRCPNKKAAYERWKISCKYDYKGGNGGGGGGGGHGPTKDEHHPNGHKKDGRSHYQTDKTRLKPGRPQTHIYYSKTVVVAKGDSLWSIAKRYGLDHKKLARINGITDPTKLQIGKVIKLG
jgi:nucleoid-associated protein YgaU